MKVFTVDRLSLTAVGLLRAALSEKTMEDRLRAIKHVFGAHQSDIFHALDDRFHIFEPKPDNLELLWKFASTASLRSEAEYEVANLLHRYKRRERKLNIAEEVGRQIVSSIQDGTFRGVGSPTGIFGIVCEIARSEEIFGAKDHDTVRKHWQTYKGIVHLGMAMTYVEENPDQDFDVFILAESIRKWLSESFPRNTKQPYVDTEDQISFVLN